MGARRRIWVSTALSHDGVLEIYCRASKYSQTWLHLRIIGHRRCGDRGPANWELDGCYVGRGRIANSSSGVDSRNARSDRRARLISFARRWRYASRFRNPGTPRFFATQPRGNARFAAFFSDLSPRWTVHREKRIEGLRAAGAASRAAISCASILGVRGARGGVQPGGVGCVRRSAAIHDRQLRPLGCKNVSKSYSVIGAVLMAGDTISGKSSATCKLHPRSALIRRS